MNKSNACLSVLMAGLLAVAGAHAQSAPAAGNSDGPPNAGEASNMTNGVPNAKTTNSPVSEVPMQSRDTVRAQGMYQGSASSTSNTPDKAGEASTTVGGNPNIDPKQPNVSKSRGEVREEVTMRRAQVDAERATSRMGYYGYGTPVGTPANAPIGTPSVFQGGTPQ